MLPSRVMSFLPIGRPYMTGKETKPNLSEDPGAPEGSPGTHRSMVPGKATMEWPGTEAVGDCLTQIWRVSSVYQHANHGH